MIKKMKFNIIKIKYIKKIFIYEDSHKMTYLVYIAASI